MKKLNIYSTTLDVTFVMISGCRVLFWLDLSINSAVQGTAQTCLNNLQRQFHFAD